MAEQIISMNHQVGVFSPLYVNSYLRRLPPKFVHGIHLNENVPKPSRIIAELNRRISGRSLRHWKPDILHETYYSRHSIPSNCKGRVLTVYDMIHEKFPASFSSKDSTSSCKRISVDRCDHVICISKSTKEDLIEIFGVPEQKVSVVYLGFDKPVMSESVNFIEPYSHKPFLLYVGARKGYKNFIRMMQAIAASTSLMKDFNVVAFGGGCFSIDELQFIAKLGFLPDQVRYRSGSDALLGEYYRGASALIYPSLYEGFGLPPLEAMSQGCPVICSNTSSMPEVIGDAGEYFDPTSIEQMRFAIETVVLCSARSNELIDLGLRRAPSFSWEACASQTLEAYRGLS